MRRTICELCNSHTLIPFYRLSHVPIRIGVAATTKTGKYLDLEYVVCTKCKNVQIANLPKLSDVYAANHNINVIGKTWQTHNQKLSEFIARFLPQEACILEIGDPAAKIATQFKSDKHIKEWHIVEPNAESLDIPKVTFIDAFFDKDFRADKSYDVLIMSHLFEHLVGLKELFPVMHNLLTANGIVVISVPNLQHILNEGSMSPAGIHFEHTFYFNKDILKTLFHNYGFELIQYESYRKHSEFFCFRKTLIPKKKLKIVNTDGAKRKILKTFATSEKKLNKFTAMYSDTVYDAVFIYGAHIQTQIYARMGLKTKKLTGVLDNDVSKHHKYVYGTSLKVFPTQDITKYTHPLIFCDMGPYTKEITQQILAINPSAKFV